MRQKMMFSYVASGARGPQSHPVRRIRAMVDLALAALDVEFKALYSHIGRPSILPEYLLRATLLQILFPMRSERLLVEKFDYNLLFRWFIGLTMNAPIGHHSKLQQEPGPAAGNRHRATVLGRGSAPGPWGEAPPAGDGETSHLSEEDV